MKKSIKYFSVLLLSLALFSCGEKEGGGGGDTPTPTPTEWTVSGRVMGDDNKPLAGVVVSDGLSCVKTDAQGDYYLPVDLSGNLTENLKHVFVSTPSGYAAPVSEGHAIFWRWLKDCSDCFDKGKGKYTGVDFTLKKIQNPERFTLYIFGDPQPRSRNTGVTDASAYHSLEVCTDMYRDFKEYAATMTDRPVYAIGLGDIVHQNTSLLQNYRDGMATTGVTTYNIIGNHDQGHTKGLTDEQSSKAFERVMGPTNYSFNLGNLHFLMLDDMIINQGDYSDNCTTGLTDDIWTFVRNDLALVPTTATIMVCAHSPLAQKSDGGERSGAHLQDLRALLRKYAVAYAWAGHTHTTFNYVKVNNKERVDPLETHTLGRVTGALWTNEFVCENGTPRGYMVAEYDNGKLTWKFKPIYYQTAVHAKHGSTSEPDYAYRDWDYNAQGRAVLKSSGEYLTDDYQMQVFKPGTYAPNDKSIYVNVFLWDELWDAPRFQLNGESTKRPMTRMDASTGDLLQYSWADYKTISFYADLYSSLKTKWYGENVQDYPDSRKRNCASIFRYTLNTDVDHGKGTVSVKDRFGNTYKTDVSW